MTLATWVKSLRLRDERIYLRTCSSTELEYIYNNVKMMVHTQTYYKNICQRER